MLILSLCLMACQTTKPIGASPEVIDEAVSAARKPLLARIEQLKKIEAVDKRCGERVKAGRKKGENASRSALKYARALHRANDEKQACYQAFEKRRKYQERR